MFCNQCGRQVGDEAAFCPGCGKVLRIAAEEDAAATTTTVMPAADPGAGPAVDPYATAWPVASESPDPVQVPYPAATPPEPSGGGWAWLVGVLIGLLVVAGVGAALYFTGALEGIGLGPEESRSSSSSDRDRDRDDREEDADDEGTRDEDREADEDSDAGGDDEASGDETADSALTPEATYALLIEHYGLLGDMHAEIGLANPDGSYGGTGFAYEVFNPGIGSPDRAVRVALLKACDGQLEQIAVLRADLEDAAIASSYQSQHRALLGLYDLLDARMRAMRDAASVALDDPSETAWRPVLTPASSDARTSFEAAFPTAEPYRE